MFEEQQGCRCGWGRVGGGSGAERQARTLEVQFLLQGIFLTQGLNLCLLQVSYIAGGFFTAEALGMPKEGEG